MEPRCYGKPFLVPRMQSEIQYSVTCSKLVLFMQEQNENENLTENSLLEYVLFSV
jgi:hypothetical protein